MDTTAGQIRISATDLAKHLACRHLTSLDLQAARGERDRVYRNDPALDVLTQRGFQHEDAYLQHLESQGRTIVRATGAESITDAIQSGVDVIVQAHLENGRWRGRADVLLKVGPASYEVVDTKLSRETRGGTILQLCLYSELVAHLQGHMPRQMHVVVPGCGFQPETFRLHDYLAYYRYVKDRLENVVNHEGGLSTYPHPVEQCDICQWWTVCNDRRRQDDHLSFVAGASTLHIDELHRWGVTTLAELAAMPVPLQRKPGRGASESYVKIREQARLQLEYRGTSTPVYELLPREPGHGIARLPGPSAGDIFLDFEGDPFVKDGGLEYLLGYVALDDAGEPHYTALWAFDKAAERHAFESFVDMVVERRQCFPDLHIYHFSHYEPTALKRLVGRYATREDELDAMLRSAAFVDLYGITKQALRASVERYSLKDLEVFFGFERKIELREASRDLRHLECALELGDLASVTAEIRQTVEGYNREDCVSALRLRHWLEGIRSDLVLQGESIPRPVMASGDASAKVDERRKRVLALMQRLMTGVPEDPDARTPGQHAGWILAHMLEWHRREDKSSWWEYFRLKDLADDERSEERSAISGLELVTRVGGTDRCPVHQYRFPPQEMQIRAGDELHTSTQKFGSVEAVDHANRTIDVKKRGDTANLHPNSIYAHKAISATEVEDALFRFGTWVADHGMDVPGPYRAARDLLLRHAPRLKAGPPDPLYRTDAAIVEEATRLVMALDHGALPIQGPPGAGKTYTAARMICALLREGKKVGITAVSHKVIRKLLEDTLKAAGEENQTISCIQKVKERSLVENPAIPETTENQLVLTALQSGSAQLAAGTAWLWAREDLADAVDVLFVDEAGQMSLADVLAVSQAARSMVLLGDPMQLDQPLQGTHPPGVAVSALQHILGTHETMPSNLGLFLGETWRLPPPICAFTSELFYDNRLEPHDGVDRQMLIGPTRFAGSGLWFVPVDHEGNQSSSNEEVAVVQEIVDDLLQAGVSWVNMKGEESRLKPEDILVVAPYNAQVFNLAERISGPRIGTVDKFQGQEAPVVIYSMTTSSPEDAPRGMEFLYSANRFNVATSRARCVCILVASPRLLEPECQTPRQMKLANVVCRYLEMADGP